MAHALTDPKDVTLYTLSQEDREFLHDIANPLAIAGGLVEAFREDTARQNLTLSESQDRKITKLAHALDRIERSISDRRRRLVAIQEALKAKGES